MIWRAPSRLLLATCLVVTAFGSTGCSDDPPGPAGNGEGEKDAGIDAPDVAEMHEVGMDVPEADGAPGDIGPDVPDVDPEDGSADIENADVISVDVLPDLPMAESGSFSFLTYNVAGLPELISGSSPTVYTPIISPLLNSYDLVVAQEDFCFHPDLTAQATHPFRSTPEYDPGCLVLAGDGQDIGDGLNRFSFSPFTEFTRDDWSVCNGQLDCASDCLTQKGFTYARHHLAQGVTVDIYNLHMDAGGCDGDIAARAEQARQLTAAIEARSVDQAVIVAGDTNLQASRPDDIVTLGQLLADAGLSDSCELVSCGNDRIDRVLLRSSATLQLTVGEWSLPPEFVDGSGNALSDHVPVKVQIDWSGTQ